MVSKRLSNYKGRNEAEGGMNDPSPVRSNVDSTDLEDLETELGMEEVELDQDVLDNTIADDDPDDSLDADDLVDEYDDEYDDDDDEGDEDEIIDNRPAAFTESYGTGLQGRPGDRSGRFSRRDTHLQNEQNSVLSGGDVDANAEDAETVGEEAVGGTVPTPDQNVVEDLAVAAGVALDDRSDLRVGDMLEQRDDRRWELDPESAEDYEDDQE